MTSSPFHSSRHQCTSFQKYRLRGDWDYPGDVGILQILPYGNVTASLGTVSLTKLTGTVFFPPDAPLAKWDVSITTPDGGRSPTKLGALTVNPWKAPTVSSVTPTSGLVNTTVSLSVSGSHFQPYHTVDFTSSTYGIIPTTLGTITPAKITGSVSILAGVIGKYGIEVLCPDGKMASKSKAFTIT